MVASNTRITTAVFLILLTFTGVGSARDYQSGPIKISQPWTRATPAGASVAAGYLSITNAGPTTDYLVAASLALAKKAEVHEMKMEGNVMRMHPVPGGRLELRPGQTVKLAPGGYHLMFMDLTRPLRQGESVDGTLVFEKAGTLPVSFQVEGIGATTPGGQHGQ